MTSSDDLRKLFEQASLGIFLVTLFTNLNLSIKHGEVKDVRMATDESGQCKGYAFIEYKVAVSSSHGSIFEVIPDVVKGTRSGGFAIEQLRTQKTTHRGYNV